MGATMAATKRHPCRDILRARRACPGCGVTMSRHALLYKHRGRGGPDATRRRRLEQLDKRIELRLGPAGGGAWAAGGGRPHRATGRSSAARGRGGAAAKSFGIALGEICARLAFPQKDHLRRNLAEFLARGGGWSLGPCAPSPPTPQVAVCRTYPRTKLCPVVRPSKPLSPVRAQPLLPHSC